LAGDSDDLLDPAEIEALLKTAGAFGNAGGLPSPSPSAQPPASARTPADAGVPSNPPPSGPAFGGPASPNGGSDILSSSEIEALLSQRDKGTSRPPPGGSQFGGSPFGGSGVSPDELLNRAQQGVSAAMSSNLSGGPPRSAPIPPRPPKPPADPRLSDARPFQFQALEDPAIHADPAGLASLEEVELDLRIELGRAELLIEDVLKLREGSVVPLDKLAGDPVDILVNGRLVARGEVLVLNDKFCVRVAEILAPSS